MKADTIGAGVTASVYGTSAIMSALSGDVIGAISSTYSVVDNAVLAGTGSSIMEHAFYKTWNYFAGPDNQWDPSYVYDRYDTDTVRYVDEHDDVLDIDMGGAGPGRQARRRYRAAAAAQR